MKGKLADSNFESDEVAFRQIPAGGSPVFFVADRAPPVHRSLFLPSSRDVDGLSLCRARFRSLIWCAYRAEKPESRFQLARLLIEEIVKTTQAVGIVDARLRATPDELDSRQGEPWAHFVVGGINRPDYDTNPDAKRRIKEWAYLIAEQIAASDVLGPFPAPTEQDAYRP